MNRDLIGKSLFRPAKPRSNVYRIMALICLILGGVWLIVHFRTGEVKPLLLPTPTPTRTANSYIQEAEAYFAAGRLDDPLSDNDAIDTYIQATKVDPTNARVWSELARIQTYSSSLLSSDDQRLERLNQAQESARKAVELAPDDSSSHAILSFVLDWNASSNLISDDQRQAYLNEAEGQAVRALQLDPNNATALAFYAEVLLDQQNWDQARQYAEQAVARAPDSMDAHRVYATVLEALGYYRDSINEYKKASDITPNFTYLHLRIGLGYRNLKVYDTALSYFDRAASINQQLGVKDPNPYIAIAKTYAQKGEFFPASLNAEKALSYAPSSPDTYGQLGSIYVQARNYESALPALKCAVDGCTVEENEIANLLVTSGLLKESVAVRPLPLTNLTVAYYYIRYGSVLAYLSDAKNGRCEKALGLMAQLRSFSKDPDLLDNAIVVEGTCRMLMGTPSP